MFDTLSKAGKYLGQAAKMMIGVPDYDNYVEHMRITHPDQTPMTYEEFFRERQDARYGGKGGARCCLVLPGLISATPPGYILKNSTFSNAARRVSGVNVTGK